MFWEDFTSRVQNLGEDWVGIGDFNETIYGYEASNRRGSGPSHHFLVDFMDTLGCVDLGFKGKLYTWTNSREGFAGVQKRLDRAICSTSWCEKFPQAVVVHLPVVNSDHSSILLNSTSNEDNSKRPFKFEAAWLRDSTCINEVEKAWNNNVVGNSLTTWHRKLKST